eukprot:2373102-Prorocentrum_lima.AAC.1
MAPNLHRWFVRAVPDVQVRGAPLDREVPPRLHPSLLPDPVPLGIVPAQLEDLPLQPRRLNHQYLS